MIAELPPTTSPAVAQEAEPLERLEAAFRSTGAVLRDVRVLPQGALEVVWGFCGQRFVSVVNAETLQVLDAGLCLDGEDERLSLPSLPGVVRQALAEGALVVTRREAR